MGHCDQIRLEVVSSTRAGMETIAALRAEKRWQVRTLVDLDQPRGVSPRQGS